VKIRWLWDGFDSPVLARSKIEYEDEYEYDCSEGDECEEGGKET
jgi:hypothetical protein